MYDVVVCCTQKFKPFLIRMLESVPPEVNVLVVYRQGEDFTGLPREINPVEVAEPFTRGVYLNRGAQASRKPYILIADADFYFFPFSFDMVSAYLQKAPSDPTYATGLVYRVPPKEMRYLNKGSRHTPGGLGAMRSYCFSGGQFFPAQNPNILPREYFLDVLGGYDERMRGWGAEDDDLQRRADRSGMRRVRLPLVVLHQHHPRGYSDTEDYRAGRAGNKAIMQENDQNKAIKSGGLK